MADFSPYSTFRFSPTSILLSLFNTMVRTRNRQTIKTGRGSNNRFCSSLDISGFNRDSYDIELIFDDFYDDVNALTTQIPSRENNCKLDMLAAIADNDPSDIHYQMEDTLRQLGWVGQFCNDLQKTFLKYDKRITTTLINSIPKQTHQVIRVIDPEERYFSFTLSGSFPVTIELGAYKCINSFYFYSYNTICLPKQLFMSAKLGNEILICESGNVSDVDDEYSDRLINLIGNIGTNLNYPTFLSVITLLMKNNILSAESVARLNKIHFLNYLRYYRVMLMIGAPSILNLQFMEPYLQIPFYRLIFLKNDFAQHVYSDKEHSAFLQYLCTKTVPTYSDSP